MNIAERLSYDEVILEFLPGLLHRLPLFLAELFPVAPLCEDL